MKVLALDLGLTVGWALIAPGQRPDVGWFRIPHRALDLGSVAIYFDQQASEIMARTQPDYIVRATRFVNRFSTPVSIGPYFGLSMYLDAMAERRHIRHGEIAEQDARKAFLGKIPRGSKNIKRAVAEGCRQRGWPFDNEHYADAICVGVHALSLLVPNKAHRQTPLLANA